MLSEDASPFTLRDLTPGASYRLELHSMFENRDSELPAVQNFTTRTHFYSFISPIAYDISFSFDMQDPTLLAASSFGSEMRQPFWSFGSLLIRLAFIPITRSVVPFGL